MRALINIIFLMVSISLIGNVLFQRKQFFPLILYLLKSNPYKTVFYSQLVLLVLFVGRFANRVMFGPISRADYEKLLEKSSCAVIETCLPFTMFKECFSLNTASLILALLVLKSFHWMTEEKIKYTERFPKVPFLNHLRISGSLLVLVTFDVTVAHLCAYSVKTHGVSGLVVLALECSLLLTSSAQMVIRYNFIDEMDFHWTWRPLALLYLKIFIAAIKLTVYFVFVAVMVKHRVLPLFALTPIYVLVRQFHAALTSTLQSNRALQALAQFPKPTREEAASCGSCVVCLEAMESSAKKLPCGHIFHPTCLVSWFQRQQTCPICRVDLISLSYTSVQTQTLPLLPSQIWSNQEYSSLQVYDKTPSIPENAKTNMMQNLPNWENQDLYN